MAEPVTVSAAFYMLADKVADLVAKKIASELAKEAVNFFFGHLATKADLQNAINDIKRHIDIQVNDLIEIDIYSKIIESQSYVDLYKINPDDSSAVRKLQLADQSLIEARSRILATMEVKEAWLYQNFALVLKYGIARTSTTILLLAHRESESDVAKWQLNDTASLVGNMKRQVEEYEIPVVEVTDRRNYIEPRDPHEPSPPRHQASIVIKFKCKRNHIPDIRMTDSISYIDKVERGAHERANAIRASIEGAFSEPLVEIRQSLENISKMVDDFQDLR